MNQFFLILSTVASVTSQAITCPSTCVVTTDDGTIFDLSGLKGKTMTTTSDSGDTYSLTLCGQDPTSCPNDSTGVFNGMAVQTQGDGGAGCYVLGVYNDQSMCQWTTAEPGSTADLSLIMQDGTSTSCMGQDRSLAVEFTCAKDKSMVVPSTFIAQNPAGTCDYVYKVSTCAVCAGGCKSGGGFGTTLLIIVFLVCLPLYLVGGSIYQYTQGKRGAEICMSLYPTTFCGYAQGGVSYVASGCQSDGSNNNTDNTGSVTKYGGISENESSTNPYQNKI